MPHVPTRKLRKSKAALAAQALEDQTVAQVNLILNGVLEDHPHLRAARDALRESESQNKFSTEFLQGFRTKLRS